MASGLCISGWVTYILRKYFDWNWKDGYPVIFGIYAAIGLIKAGLTLLLTERCEPNYSPHIETDIAEREATAPLMSDGRRTSYTKPSKVTGAMRKIGETVTTKISPESRPILIRLCFLFAINSFAQGMLPVTLMSWYANYRYRWFLTYRLGYAMAAVWLVASVANLFSASVARRLGLIRAMVFTHLPNAIFLAFIPLASSWWLMLMLLLVSSAFGSMDQAPRSAFVAAAFLPSERTAVMGTINLVKTIASAGGPLLTGYFHDKKMWGAVFVIAAVLKILYDIGLLAMFLKTKLPEHGRRPREVTVSDVDVGILLNEQLVDPDEFERDDDDEEMGGHDGGYNSGHGKGRYEEIEEI
jgi:Major Facilitator Superfamily